ncbi:hypothetical protein LI328DRAFT_34721 [Trichoderma asperelloides]|nr:hypothetical protein LI328DRAFT_34721 [Trichoderma asperelloides]
MTIYYTQYIYHYMRHDAFVLKLEIVPFFFVPVPPCIFYIANPSNTIRSISSKHEHVAVKACHPLTNIA